MRNNSPMPRTPSRPGDPARLLGLLWAPARQTGRSGITLQAIVQAGMAVADEQGFGAVTMRRVAEVMGVGAMTLYTYVPGRPELVELMVDAVAASTYAGRSLPGDLAGWRDGLEYVAWRNWEHTLAHRWLVDVPPGRPILGPGVCLKYEHELTPLDGCGLHDVSMDHLLTTVLGMVAGAARWQIGLDRTRAESALTDEQWWALAGPAMERAMGDLELPIASRVGVSVGSAGDPAESLRFGLRRLLDGVQADL